MADKARSGVMWWVCVRCVLADEVGHVQSSWVMVSFGQADGVSRGALGPVMDELGMADEERCVESWIS